MASLTRRVRRRTVICVILLLVGAQLVYAQDSVRFEAEMLDARTIQVSGDRIDATASLSDFELTTYAGKDIALSDVLPRRSDVILMKVAEALDPARLYVVHSLKDSLSTFVGREGWCSTLYSDQPLGAIVSDDGAETVFRLFAPRASGVTLHLFLSADQPVTTPEKSVNMMRDMNGVWEATQSGDHHGVFYTYTIEGPDEPGNLFFDTHPEHISDPYALVSDDSFGKAMVYKPTPAPKPLKNGRPDFEDIIAYEVHVQDFTDELPVARNKKGTFSAMITPGLSNENNAPIGFDHLTSLGINTVHLMPVQEFLHYPDSLWQAAFSEDAYMIEQGISEENYQWGYRTTHAFAVESRYRTLGSPIGAEREQFKALVEAFHAEDMAVIIDVVPNHTGENMAGRNFLFNFNAIDKPYYYRTNSKLEHIGPYGNEIKSEYRPMVQRWILDQLQHFVDVFGVDGFRIDLAGQIDEQTLIWLKNELPEDLIIYGEAWIAPSDPTVANDPDLGWYKADAPIPFFQDDARNAFKGTVWELSNPAIDRGFAGGNGEEREAAMRGLANDYFEEPTPNHGINYLDIHDNWALADQFSDVDWDGRRHVDEGRFKIAATLLFTSLGPIVLHGGTEMMRSKGHSPLEEIEKQVASGTIYIHGKRDTYNLRKANAFLWEQAGALATEDRPMNYAQMTDFWRGLIALRSSSIGDVFTIGHDVPDGYFKWILPDNNQLLGYTVDEKVLVLVNTADDAADFKMDNALPEGYWIQVSDGSDVNIDGCDCGTDFESPIQTIRIPAKTAQIWKRR